MSLEAEHSPNASSLLEIKKSIIAHEAAAAYTQSFAEANQTIARLVGNVLGREAAAAMSLTERQDIRTVCRYFHQAALETTTQFAGPITEAGEYDPEKETAFWTACDHEGPIAQKNLFLLLKELKFPETPETVRSVINTVTVQDAVVLSLQTLKKFNHLTTEESAQIKTELLQLCENPLSIRELLKKVISPSDYYYGRIDRTEKVNDESILKFSSPEPHTDRDLIIIETALRLTNATWFAAQRHCAKKDGTTDRINPAKRNRVFNTPDFRHIHQYKEALQRVLTKTEAVMILVFELTKDAWMLEE